MYHQCRQYSGLVGEGVEVDPVRHHLRFMVRRVAVHDHLRMEVRPVQEFFPYPDEILKVLPFERYAGAYARVAEEEVA